MEYLLIHRGGRGQSFVYELMFARPSDGGRPVLGGLIDMDVLSKHDYDEKKSGQTAQRSGPSRPQAGGMVGALKAAPSPASMRVPEDEDFEVAGSTYTGVKPNGHYVLTMSGVK
jgi:DNA primase